MCILSVMVQYMFVNIKHTWLYRKSNKLCACCWRMETVSFKTIWGRKNYLFGSCKINVKSDASLSFLD